MLVSALIYLLTGVIIVMGAVVATLLTGALIIGLVFTASGAVALWDRLCRKRKSAP